MRITITVPKRLTDPLADALACCYGVTAEALTHASADTPGARECLREHHADLIETFDILAQLHATNRPSPGPAVGDLRVTGEREILSDAVYDLLRSAVETLDTACDLYPSGANDVPDLERAHHHIADVLRLFRATELLPPTTTTH
jgi:hypothetical protein